jgi:hypothetical protein
MAFHHYSFDEKVIAALALEYGTGPPDRHGGGYQEVLWRTFVIELRMMDKPELPPAPNPYDPSILQCMSELRYIAEEEGLSMVHVFQVQHADPTDPLTRSPPLTVSRCHFLASVPPADVSADRIGNG